MLVAGPNQQSQPPCVPPSLLRKFSSPFYLYFFDFIGFGGIGWHRLRHRLLPQLSSITKSTKPAKSMFYSLKCKKVQPMNQDAVPSAKIKSVRFDESQNQSFANDGRAAEHCHKTWYTKREYNQMRASTQETIQGLLKRNRKQGNRRHDLSYSEILKALLDLVISVDYIVEDPTSILNADIKHKLSLLYTQDEDSVDLIGMEPHVESRLRRESLKRRINIQDVVYDVQKEYKAGLLDEDQVDSELRESCLVFSQASRLFAQFQAQASLLVPTA